MEQRRDDVRGADYQNQRKVVTGSEEKPMVSSNVNVTTPRKKTQRRTVSMSEGIVDYR